MTRAFLFILDSFIGGAPDAASGDAANTPPSPKRCH
jgi:hypothetical protein